LRSEVKKRYLDALQEAKAASPAQRRLLEGLWVLGTPLTARARRLIPQGIVRLAESFCRVSPVLQTLGPMPRSANLVGLLGPRRAGALQRSINDTSADFYRQKRRQRDPGAFQRGGL
jgi:hypothetical protein